MVAQERGSWTLYRRGARLAIEVMCGSVGLHEIRATLNEAGRAAFKTSGVPALLPLTRAVQLDPGTYAGRG